MVTHSEKPRRRYKCRVCLSRWECLEIIDGEPDWLENVLGHLLSEGRLEAYFDRLPHISALIATSGKQPH
jgi:hypothetical protein